MCYSAFAFANGEVKADTVIIEFGESSKLIIYTKNSEELKDLEAYDINKIIKDLNLQIDSTAGSTNYITLEPNSNDYANQNNDATVNYLPVKDDNLKYYGSDDDDDDDDYYYSSRNRDRDDDNGISYVFRNKRRRNRGTRNSFQVEIGMNNWLENGSFPDANNEPYSVKPWGSWYFGMGWNNRTSAGRSFYIDWGGNITWYAFKMEDTSVRIEKTDTQTTFVADPTIRGEKSKLAATYVNAYAVPMIEFGGRSSRYSRKGFRVGAGMYAGYRIDSWIKHKYQDADGNNQKDKEHSNFYMNNWRYGIRGQVGFRGMDFFMNYDLNEVFAKGRGPQLNAISFGFII